MDELKILKRAVLREELVAVCGDHISALILNQFIMYSIKIAPSVWIKKKAKEIKEDIMLSCSENTIMRRIDFLINIKILKKKEKKSLDKTGEYKIDFCKLEFFLIENGYNNIVLMEY